MRSLPIVTVAGRLLAAVLTLALVVTPGIRHAGAAQTSPGPAVRLVLLVSVDQFRYDYLTRFRPAYRHGFHTLLTRGAVFTDAQLEHANTVTAVGHATMLSGALPTVSGIIGNSWYDRETGAAVTSVSDPGQTLLGATGEASSPHRLLVSTIADEIKMAAGTTASTRPRAVGVSMKDRSAILAVGRTADAAYWFDNASGAFVTSTYYMQEAPGWVAGFNARRMIDEYAGTRWAFTTSDGGRDLPREVGPVLNDAVYTSPFGNDILLAFAKEALQREQLGQRGVTDVFSVSFSSNDAVGHRYGPDSPEVHDIAVKTDVVIGELLAEVDRAVGLAQTLVIFTTDHGVGPLPETAQALKLPGGRFAGKTVDSAIQHALDARFGQATWLLAGGSSVYLDHEVIGARGLDAAVVRRVAADAAAAVPHVARVYTREELVGGALPGDRVGQRVARSHHARRSGDLEIVLEPYWIRGATGATHGSPYGYDSHIPLVLLGPGIVAGAYHAHVSLNDVAPTLAALLQIETPSGSSGRALVEALAK